MPTTKKKAAKKAPKKPAAPTTVLDPCTRNCLARYQACLRQGGSKIRCIGRLIQCLDDCP
jgi:hypothetical protein